MSSWLDRLAIGVMVFNMMRLPRLFPRFSLYHELYRTHGRGYQDQRRRGE